MTAVGITYIEKPSRDKNIDDYQQIGVKFERTCLKIRYCDSISDRLIIHLRYKRNVKKIFNFRRILRQVYMAIFKRIISYVKFVPCIMHCVLLLTLVVLFILPSSFDIESTNDKVLIFQQ